MHLRKPPLRRLFHAQNGKEDEHQDLTADLKCIMSLGYQILTHSNPICYPWPDISSTDNNESVWTKNWLKTTSAQFTYYPPYFCDTDVTVNSFPSWFLGPLIICFYQNLCQPGHRKWPPNILYIQSHLTQIPGFMYCFSEVAFDVKL